MSQSGENTAPMNISEMTDSDDSDISSPFQNVQTDTHGGQTSLSDSIIGETQTQPSSTHPSSNLPSALTVGYARGSEIDYVFGGSRAVDCLSDEACHTIGDLYERYSDKVFKYLIRQCSGDISIAADMMHDTFEHAARFVAHYPEQTTFENERVKTSWLFEIASHIAIDWYRRPKKLLRQKHVSFISLEAMTELKGDSEYTLPGSESSEDNLINNMILTRALATLDPESRRMLLLYTLHDISYEELAALSHCTYGAAKMRIVRAREELRRAYFAGGGDNVSNDTNSTTT